MSMVSPFSSRAPYISTSSPILHPYPSPLPFAEAIPQPPSAHSSPPSSISNSTPRLWGSTIPYPCSFPNAISRRSAHFPQTRQHPQHSSSTTQNRHLKTQTQHFKPSSVHSPITPPSQCHSPSPAPSPLKRQCSSLPPTLYQLNNSSGQQSLRTQPSVSVVGKRSCSIHLLTRSQSPVAMASQSMTTAPCISNFNPSLHQGPAVSFPCSFTNFTTQHSTM